MRIAFVHYPGRIARLEAARAGTAPSEFLFGAVELERRGHDVEHFEVDPEMGGGRAWPAIDRFVHRGYLPPHVSGVALEQTRRLLSALTVFDVVVGTTIGTSLPLAFWRWAGRLDVPLVGIVSGLAEPHKRRSRRALIARLLRQMDTVLYGEAELAGMLALDPRLVGRVHVNQFGVDVAYWTPADPPSDGYILSIGNDGRRDYATLVRAASGIPAPVRIVTGHEPPADLPPNVSWQPGDWHRQVLTDDEVRSLYRAARAVVVPLRNSIRPSGQSVTLQAMACGRPVVLSDTDGLWSRATMRDGDNVVLVPAGDAGALARGVNSLLDEPDRGARLGAAGRATVVGEATVDHFADRMLAVCRSAVERSPEAAPLASGG